MKILIDSKHGLGDCVHIIPMLHILKQNYPDSYIAIIVAGKANADLLSLSDVKIDRFFYLNIKTITIKSILNLIIEIRKENFNYFILSPITSTWKAKIFTILIGVKNKIGEQYQNFSKDYINKTHRVERNINLLKSFCTLPKNKLNPLLFVECNDFNDFNNMESLIGICVGGGNPVIADGLKVYPKSWNIFKIKQLISELIRLNFKIILFGGKEEEDFLQKTQLKSNKNLFNFINKTSITETAALVSKCRLIVGVDTGVMHIADALGIKTLSIFGPTNPKVVGAYSKNADYIEHNCECKYCYGTSRYITCTDRKCLNEIKVQEVLDEIKRILKWESYQ